MPVYLTDEQLFHLLVAVIFRECGYIAGIPRRLLRGRGTCHQVNVVGVEVSPAPFTFNTVIVPEVSLYNGKRDELELLKCLRATLLDLEQTMPSRPFMLPELINTSAGEFFHKIYGGPRNRPESLTVHYVGVLLTDKWINHRAMEYANAHGIYVVFLPTQLAGMSIGKWMEILRSELDNSLKNDRLTHESLFRHTRKVEDYINVLQKIRSPRYDLEPGETHDLLTIVYAILRKEPMRKLLHFIRQLVLASIDNYPVVLQVSHASHTQLMEGAARFYAGVAKRYRSRGKTLAEKMRLLGEVRETEAKNIYLAHFRPDSSYCLVVPQLQKLRLKTYLPAERIERMRHETACLRLPLKDGLSLVLDLFLEPEIGK